ncbi:LacI family DNA-binding transcriptional regulator [Fictibacillus terranigra]|uniref:LacI family DNA-binding transcriptional regulator n=1 Tax=Fictibacillus terranigra TaxID=3058424 RepID=A0ABT8EDW3_9BACL|nr:LacI family DNA-binding transcriptional regulator [Fictibacillus sp. CENA-BCM004]MDN4076009.1 LacI family DNA-binding transcriptional regulator [Fictibacillus sp. CENA-BCM004]
MATIKDVAKLASVSVSTASIALNGNKNVKTETRVRVLEAAKKLNYRKNGSAADLKKSQTKTLALIVDDLSGPFFSELIKGVQDVTLSKGYDLITCSAIGGENSTPTRFLLEKRTDGVIILAHTLKNEMILHASMEGFPIVLLDRQLDSRHTIHIQVDNEQGAYNAVHYLISLGHRSIAYVSGNATSTDNHCRYRGFQKAMDEFGLEQPDKWNISGSFTEEGGYHTTKMLIMQGQLPSAIFYANDEMAIGGIQAFSEKGIKVPEDVSIIGFDDILLSRYTTPALTTIHQPKYEMGSLAAHLIFRALSGESFEQQLYTLETRLVKRSSCRQV